MWIKKILSALLPRRRPNEEEGFTVVVGTVMAQAIRTCMNAYGVSRSVLLLRMTCAVGNLARGLMPENEIVFVLRNRKTKAMIQEEVFEFAEV